MELTFLTHGKYFLKRMDGLPFGRWLFFSVWITEYLYRQYGQELRARFEEEEELDLGEVLAFLWYTVEKANAGEPSLGAAAALDEELMSRYIEALENDDIYNDLDQTDTRGIGQAVLISAFYNALKFIESRETRLVAGAAFFPLDIIDCLLTNDLELSHQQSTIQHPLHQAELTIQDRLIDYLHAGKKIGKEQKDLFRITTSYGDTPEK